MSQSPKLRRDNQFSLPIHYSGDNVETLELTEQTVNPGQPKTGPHDFELLKLLGKGGYGKVSFASTTPMKFQETEVTTDCGKHASDRFREHILARAAFHYTKAQFCRFPFAQNTNKSCRSKLHPCDCG